MQTFNLDIPRMGYFILYRNEGTLIGNGIQRVQRVYGFSSTHSQYTHIEVSGGGADSVCVEPPKAKNINLQKKHKDKYIKIVRYRGIDYIHKRYKVAFYAATKCNLKYDFFGIISFLLKYIRSAEDRYFCSENAANALRKEYPEVFGELRNDEIMPAHFLGKEFEIVWEGRIN